jgi:hypothetical protein
MARAGVRRPPLRRAWHVAAAAAAVAVAGLLTHAPVGAQEESGEARLLAYFPFDGGSVEEAARGIASGVVVEGEAAFDGFGVVSEDEGPSGATTGEADPDGRYGDALAFTGESRRVLAPLDLDFGTHPRITVSLWVKVESDEAAERGHLLSTGRGADRTPGLSLQNGHVVAAAGGGRLHNYAAELEVGAWNHVAAIWDSETRTVRVYTNGRGDERAGIEDLDPGTIAAHGRSQSELENPLRPEWLPTRHLVLGALGIQGFREARGVSLDEVRIWSGALSEAELAEIMNADSPPPLGPVAPPPPPPAERETVTETADDRWDTATDEETEEERGELVGWELSDDYELSGVSGSTGESTTRAEFSGPGTETAYATTMEVWERGNRPCMIVLGAQIRGERAATVGSGPPCDATESRRQLQVGMGAPITGIEVCQRRTNDRVKGLRATARRWDLTASELRFREEREEDDEAPNCNGNWQEAVSCPSGFVASGAVAHWENQGRSGPTAPPMDALVGVELICREMVGVYR